MMKAPSDFCLHNRYRSAVKAVVCALLFASLASGVGGLLAQDSATAPSRAAGPPGKGGLAAQEVDAAGEGATEDEAFRQAVVDAVRQVVGTLVSAENVVSNEKVIKDEVLTLSNGFVEKVIKRGRRKLPSGSWEVKLRCLVRKGQVYDKLREANVPTVRFDGVSVFADVVSQLDHQKSSVTLILKALETISPALVTAVMLEEKPKIIERSDKYTDVEITWRASVDLDAFFTKCTPALDAAFSGAATAKSKKLSFTAVKGTKESGMGYRILTGSDVGFQESVSFDQLAAVPVTREKSKWGIQFYQCDKRILSEVRERLRSSGPGDVPMTWSASDGIPPIMLVECCFRGADGRSLSEVRMISLRFVSIEGENYYSQAHGTITTPVPWSIEFGFLPLLKSDFRPLTGPDQGRNTALETDNVSAKTERSFWSLNQRDFRGSSVLQFRSRVRLSTALLSQIGKVDFSVKWLPDSHRSPRLKGQ